jgi:hypothetical protein
MSEQPLHTSIALNLRGVHPRLSAAHRELYLERIAERIPLLSDFVLPWLPRLT